MLETISLPFGVRYIYSKAFMNCISLVSADLPRSIGHILDQAFFNCTALNKVKLDNIKCRISDDAFIGCASLADAPEIIMSAKHFAINDGIVENETGVFTFDMGKLVGFEEKEGVTDIILPEGTWEVDGVFCNNDRITSIVFPETVDRIYSIDESIFDNAKGAFENCTSLKKVILPTPCSSIRIKSFIIVHFLPNAA